MHTVDYRNNLPEAEKMGKPTRLILADDNLHARHGLRAVLTSQQGIEIAGEASQGDEAIALVEALHPDVVLLDVRMPVKDGLQATRIIKKRWPKVRVILISMYPDYQTEALSIDADAFLIKGCSTEELVTAITGNNKE
jgi:YesN/AraC family two-component response regulator